MHFVLGGSFNGKTDWVRQMYPTAKASQTEWRATIELPLTVGQDTNLLVLENIEMMIKKCSSQNSSDQVRNSWKSLLSCLKSWEEETSHRTVVFIGTDITKGIVPIDASDRKWRDEVGWCYQDTVKECHRVDQIWYGLARRLK